MSYISEYVQCRPSTFNILCFASTCTCLVFQVGRVQARLVCFEAMLTPSFDIEQNEEFVILTIRVPYIKVGTSSLMHV